MPLTPSRMLVSALSIALSTVAAGCDLGLSTPSQGGSFKASTANGAGANNSKSSFDGTTISGTFTRGLGTGGNGGILTVSALATGLTSADTQSVSVNLGSPVALAAGQSFTVGASQSGAVAYAIITYAETTGSDNSKTKSWKAGSGTVRIDSVSGKTVSLSFTNVAMVVSDQMPNPGTGTFNFTGTGKIDAVSGL